MARSFLDLFTGNDTSPTLGDLFAAPGTRDASLGDLFGNSGAAFPSLGTLFGGTGASLPTLGSILGGTSDPGPTLAAGMADIKAKRTAKDEALKPKTPPAQPGTQSATSTLQPTAPASAGQAAAFAEHLPYAQQALQAAGWNPDLAPVMLGIAANEGAFAPGTLAAAPTNNVFGIKATPDWQGGTVTMPTREYRNGQWVTEPATFRTYATPRESYADHIRFLQENARYANAIQQQGSPTDFLQAVAQAGYATDPEWANKVLSLARQASTATAPTGPAVPVSSGTVGGQPWRIAFDFAAPYTTPLPSGISTHRGVDLVIPGAPDNGRGQSYTAFVPGTVAAITNDPAGGQGIIVQGADGLYQRYFHNDRVLVRQGQPVDQNTPLGIVGASGTEGFPHLHFEVSRNINGDRPTQLIDPRPYLQGALQ